MDSDRQCGQRVCTEKENLERERLDFGQRERQPGQREVDSLKKVRQRVTV